MQQIIKTRKAFAKVADRGEVILSKKVNSQFGIALLLLPNGKYETYKINWNVIAKLVTECVVLPAILYTINPQKKEDMNQ